MPFLRSFSIDTEKRNPFPFNIPAVRFARQARLDPGVTIFVGDNGCGKSTILESIGCTLELPLIGRHVTTKASSFLAGHLIKQACPCTRSPGR